VRLKVFLYTLTTTPVHMRRSPVEKGSSCCSRYLFLPSFHTSGCLGHQDNGRTSGFFRSKLDVRLLRRGYHHDNQYQRPLRSCQTTGCFVKSRDRTCSLGLKTRRFPITHGFRKTGIVRFRESHNHEHRDKIAAATMFPRRSAAHNLVQ
jgi:hypothetical protein